MDTYRFTDMPAPLLDFALSLGSEFTIDLFDGGLIARSAAVPTIMVATVNPSALTDDAETHLAVELALDVSYRAALTALRLTDSTTELVEDDLLSDLHPDLEFMVLRPAKAAA